MKMWLELNVISLEILNIDSSLWKPFEESVGDAIHTLSIKYESNESVEYKVEDGN